MKKREVKVGQDSIDQPREAKEEEDFERKKISVDKGEAVEALVERLMMKRWSQSLEEKTLESMAHSMSTELQQVNSYLRVQSDIPPNHSQILRQK